MAIFLWIFAQNDVEHGWKKILGQKWEPCVYVLKARILNTEYPSDTD